jgi:alpha-ketoglutarate-dependent taurine dioxygenase
MGELRVRELSPALGAEIEGLEPAIPLSEDTCRQLRQLFDERGVLVFPNLDIDRAFQEYLVFMLVGQDPPAQKSAAGDEETEDPVAFVSNTKKGGNAPYGRLLFHCDSMWAEEPHPSISLYGVEAEEPGVPTMFVSMGHAWDTLPDDLRRRVDGLEARHGHDHYYPNRGGDDDVIDTYFEHPQSTTTPVAHRHPRTGRTLLYVSEQATIEILGLPEDENEELLKALFAHLYSSSNVLRHDWRKGDLVIWDNLAVQHGRSTVALEGPARTLRKVFGPAPASMLGKEMPKFSKVANR